MNEWQVTLRLVTRSIMRGRTQDLGSSYEGKDNLMVILGDNNCNLPVIHIMQNS